MNNQLSRRSTAERIKRLRKEHRYSQSFVAQDLSITQAAYSRIENSNNGIVAEHIVRLSDLFKVTTDYILKGNTRLTEMSFEKGFLPLITSKAHAGFVKDFKEKINYDDRDWFRIPGFNPSIDQRLFEVEGESMAPTIFPGDVLVCQVQPNINNLLNGSLVLLITEGEVVAKRFDRLQDGKVLLQNDNSDHPEQQVVLEISEIQQALNIRGKITSTLVPHHQILSNSKINDLEETIDWLKKELFSLTKIVESLNGGKGS